MNFNNSSIIFSDNISCLKNKFDIKNKTIPNRIVYQPMEGCDGTPEGKPGELTKRRYLRLAEGGPGVIWMEAVAVCQEGKANPRQLHLNENTLDSFKRLIEMIKNACCVKNGFEPIVIAQLTHSGRYSKPHGTPEPVIAYNNALFETDNPIDRSRIITDEELEALEEVFENAVKLTYKAGFDGADLKCCHRYLASELLSAYERSGRYGGSFENRSRFILNLVKRSAALNKDFITAVRLNIFDGFPYPFGFGVKNDGSLEPDLSEPFKLIGMLKDQGLDFLNVTMGNPYVNPRVNRPSKSADSGTQTREDDPVRDVERILWGAREVQEKYPDLPTVCSGISYLRKDSVYAAAGFVEGSRSSFAGFGRMTLAYPDAAKDILNRGELDSGKVCITCGKCSELMGSGGMAGCVVRDNKIYKQFTGSMSGVV